MVGVLSKVMGLLLILVGLWLALTILAFASLVNPSLQGDAWWAEYWEGMSAGKGWSGLGMDLGLASLGSWLLVIPPSRSDGPGTKPVNAARDAHVR